MGQIDFLKIKCCKNPIFEQNRVLFDRDERTYCELYASDNAEIKSRKKGVVAGVGRFRQRKMSKSRLVPQF